MSAIWQRMKLGLSAEAARFERFFRIATRQDLKRQPITKDLKESIKAFRVVGAKIELQPMNYLASIELRDAGSSNILAARRQVIKTEVDDRTHYKSRLMSRAAANVSRFL